MERTHEMKTVYERKVGAFELAVGVAVVELVAGSGLRAVLFGAVAIGLYYAKSHFKGEFSLADLRGLLKGNER
jgi:hypothetical protein